MNQEPAPRGYYGRTVLKPPVWKDDIAYYFFLGGLSAGTSLLAAGADLTGRAALRQRGRIGAVAAIGLGTVFLVRDLGRPERFHHMLRVAKITSPMSVGTWVLTAYGPLAGAAAVSEVLPAGLRRRAVGRILMAASRPAGLGAALLAPVVASYTAVLVSDTAVPAWRDASHLLPVVFTTGAASTAGGLGMIVSPISDAVPARRLAISGALGGLVSSSRLSRAATPSGDAYRSSDAGRFLERAEVLNALGLLGASLLGRRNRLAAVASGSALLLAGLYERLGVLRAGMASSRAVTA